MTLIYTLRGYVAYVLLLQNKYNVKQNLTSFFIEGQGKGAREDERLGREPYAKNVENHWSIVPILESRVSHPTLCDEFTPQRLTGTSVDNSTGWSENVGHKVSVIAALNTD